MTSLLTDLEQLTKADVSSLDPMERRKATQLARRLVSNLETPTDYLLPISWVYPAYFACLKVCFDLKIFDILASAGAEKFVPLEALAEKSGADPRLLSRILRHVAAVGTLDTKAPNLYRATIKTEALREDTTRDIVDLNLDFLAKILGHTPTYLAQTGYKDLVDHKETIFNGAFGTDLNSWAYLGAHPQVASRFGNAMAGYAADQGSWTDVYPVQEWLLAGTADTDVLIVDVGGGLGQDMRRLRSRYPPNDARGRIIVQDQPTVVADALEKHGSDPAIELTPHDFFTPQSIHGAKAYYLHSVLHDWSDEQAVAILQNIVPAMKSGYSKVLINEVIIPAERANPYATALDMIMMGTYSSRERTTEDWNALVEKAGLRVEGMWVDDGVAVQGVVEAVLA